MTIRTGIIGFGVSGQIFHAPFLDANEAFSVELVATGNPERVANARQKYEVVATPDELLARAGELDLVVLSSPPSVHVDQGLRALAAGASVVTDKPFAPSVAGAEALLAAAASAGQQVFVFQSRRWDGDLLTIKKLLDADTLGRVYRFESSLERSVAVLRTPWHGELPVAQGGGVTFDIGAHLIDQAIHLFGDARLAYADMRFVREGRASEDDSFVVLEHSGGVTSHLRMSRVAGQSSPRFRVLGSDGAYVVRGVDGQEDFIKAGGLPTDAAYGLAPESSWGTLGTTGNLVAHATERGDYGAFYRGVAASMLEGAPPPVDPLDSIKGLRIITEAHDFVKGR